MATADELLQKPKPKTTTSKKKKKMREEIKTTLLKNVLLQYLHTGRKEGRKEG